MPLSRPGTAYLVAAARQHSQSGTANAASSRVHLLLLAIQRRRHPHNTGSAMYHQTKAAPDAKGKQ